MTIDETPELVPPSPERVAQRSLVLSAVVCRSGIESDAGNHQAEAFRKDLVGWIERLDLNHEAEPKEMELLKTPLGKLSKKTSIEASWQAEGLAVLAWALRKYELPAYDIQAVGPDIADALGFMQEKDDTILPSPRLKTAAEIEALADHLFTLHWRLRQFSLDQAAMDFQEFARTAWFGPLPLDGLRLLEKDLEIHGKPIIRATEAQWREALGMAQERHQAVNWLQGQNPIYSEVTADT